MMNAFLQHETEKPEVLKEIRDFLKVIAEKSTEPPRRFLTKTEIAKQIGVSIRTVNNKIKAGHWKAHEGPDGMKRLDIHQVEASFHDMKQKKNRVKKTPKLTRERLTQLIEG